MSRNRSEFAANVSLAAGARIPSPIRYYTKAQRRERERQWAFRWLSAQVIAGVVILGACAILSACGFH